MFWRINYAKSNLSSPELQLQNHAGLTNTQHFTNSLHLDIFFVAG
jgi:hypothetical protein